MQILGAHYRGFGARGDCTAIGHGFRTAPTLAAALNGASMHMLDFEPMWTSSNHALSTTLPHARRGWHQGDVGARRPTRAHPTDATTSPATASGVNRSPSTIHDSSAAVPGTR
jgi:hypothetical protein